MNTILIIIIGVIVLLLVAAGIVFAVRIRRFRPDSDKERQQEILNEDLKEPGFAYHRKNDYFYSRMDCWQREVGYCKLYDEGAPYFNMIIDSEPVEFSYQGKRWLIELWKGQYGITTGAEIGIYNTSRDDISTEKFTGTFYEAIQDEERMQMAFTLKRRGRVILKRNGLHWWLTGFKLGDFSKLKRLTMDASITFPNVEMCMAFVKRLQEIGYRRREYKVENTRVVIHFTKPHSPQPITRNKMQEILVQKVNKSNCKLYRKATSKYSDTLDKLEYLKNVMPELYDLFVKSLYARGIYEAFDWIRDIIFPPRPPHPPKPPCLQCPPEPSCPSCPPEPPCPPKRPCPSEPSCPPKPPCSSHPVPEPESPCHHNPSSSLGNSCTRNSAFPTRPSCPPNGSCMFPPFCSGLTNEQETGNNRCSRCSNCRNQHENEDENE